MTPGPTASHRPGLVVVDLGKDATIYLRPDSTRRLADDLNRAADRAEGIPEKKEPRRPR